MIDLERSTQRLCDMHELSVILQLKQKKAADGEFIHSNLIVALDSEGGILGSVTGGVDGKALGFSLNCAPLPICLKTPKPQQSMAMLKANAATPIRRK